VGSALFTSTNHPCKVLALEYTDIASPFSIILPIADDAKCRTGRRAPRTSKDWRASSHFLCQSCMVSCVDSTPKHTIQHQHYPAGLPFKSRSAARAMHVLLLPLRPQLNPTQPHEQSKLLEWRSLCYARICAKISSEIASQFRQITAEEQARDPLGGNPHKRHQQTYRCALCPNGRDLRPRK